MMANPDRRIGLDAETPALTGLSASSRWEDHTWHLDDRTAGQSASSANIRWHIALPDDSYLTDLQHSGWLATGRALLWCLRMNPAVGQQPCSTRTLPAKMSAFRVLVRWMHNERLRRFADIDAFAIERYLLYLRSRPGRRRQTLAPGSVLTHLSLLRDLWLLRATLPDALHSDPFPDETPAAVAGDLVGKRRPIAFIPDDLAIDILSKALVWVEQEAASIIDARTRWYSAYHAASERSQKNSSHYKYATLALKEGQSISPGGWSLSSTSALRQAVKHLSAACFIVIAGFVGMRVSEILSLRVGAVEHDPDQPGAPGRTWLKGRLYKTKDRSPGHAERWIAPIAAVHAVDVLERLTSPHRGEHQCKELFLGNSAKGRVPRAVSSNCMTTHINDFAALVGVPSHQGKPWSFTPHQFRKTFARFVAKRDRTQLMGLADHFKHASTFITSRSYVGTNFELSELVRQEARTDTAAALERMLSGAPTAGRIGERLAAVGATFRGRAGTQIRRDYIRFILEETDLQVHACEYGWCVFQPETARCGGIAGPAPAGRSPSTCLSCSNFAVDDQHRPWWEDRRTRNLALAAESDRLTGAVMNEVIAQCDQVLRKLKD
jgi:integrase